MVLQDLVVGDDGAEDEDRVAHAVADEIGAGSDADHLAVGVVGGDDAGHVRAVARGGVAVVVGALIDGDEERLRGRAGDAGVDVDDLDVVGDAVGEIRVGRVDAAVDHGHAHAAAVDAQRVHVLGVDGRVRGHRDIVEPVVGIDVGGHALRHGRDHGVARAPQECEWQPFERLDAKPQRAQAVDLGRRWHDAAEDGDAVDGAVEPGLGRGQPVETGVADFLGPGEARRGHQQRGYADNERQRLLQALHGGPPHRPTVWRGPSADNEGSTPETQGERPQFGGNPTTRA